MGSGFTFQHERLSSCHRSMFSEVRRVSPATALVRLPGEMLADDTRRTSDSLHQRRVPESVNSSVPTVPGVCHEWTCRVKNPGQGVSHILRRV